MICASKIEELFPAPMRAPPPERAARVRSGPRDTSYVAAADELNVTPAAVGQLVRGLEETLGLELFHRSQGWTVQTGSHRRRGQAALPDLQEGFDRLSTAVSSG